MSEATKKVEKEDEVVDKTARKTANEAAAMIRKLGKRLEDVFGIDLDGDGKVGKFGFSRVGVLVCIAVIGLFAALAMAETVEHEFFTDAVYGTAKASGNSSTLQGTLTADDLVAEDDLTVADDASVGGDLTVTGNQSLQDLAVAGDLTVTSNILNTALTASKPVFTDASKNLVSTGTVPVDQGGTGVATLTDGGVLLGSGTAAVTPMAVLADSEMIVGDGTTDPVAESGATLRTSIGVGTGDSPQFTGLTLTGDLDVQGGNITMEQDAELDNSVVAALGVTFPSASSVSNLGQIIVVSTDTNIDDDYVADIAGLNALGSTNANVGYASIRVTVTDVTDTSEDSTVTIYNKVAGANTAQFVVGADGISTPGNCDVTGTLTASGLLDSDTTGVTGDFNVAGDFSVDTNATVGGTLGVTGIATLAEVSINAGTIDDVVIGGGTAVAGTFSTLAASSLTVDSLGAVLGAGATEMVLDAGTFVVGAGGTVEVVWNRTFSVTPFPIASYDCYFDPALVTTTNGILTSATSTNGYWHAVGAK